MGAPLALLMGHATAVRPGAATIVAPATAVVSAAALARCPPALGTAGVTSVSLVRQPAQLCQGAAVVAAGVAALAAAYARRPLPRRRHLKAARLCRRALRWDVVESSQADLTAAVAELVSGASAAAAAGPPDFGLLVVPARWASELAAASKHLRDAGVLPEGAPLVGMQSGSDAGEAGGTLRLGMARGSGGKAIPFFVTKEQQSQAGAGLARENPIPGVPDGQHGSFLLFADPKVSGALTKNLLEALDSRYPQASKTGVVVLPVKPKAGEEPAEEEEWEPPREGRQLRVRDRSDGHGWLRGDPTYTSTSESFAAADTVMTEYKRRPFGIKRYSPGVGGKGAMVMEMQEKSRYPGDAMGQAAVSGVRTGMVLKTVAGKDVRDWDFEDLMDLLNDQGIMDPDSKSAASWGAGGQIQRQPIPEAELPLPIEYMLFAGGGSGSGSAALCLDGMSKKEGTLGVALPVPAASSLDLTACQPMGPALEVTKSGKNPDGGFAVYSVNFNGKEMAAATALKGFAKTAGLQSMKGISVGVVRPQGGGEAGGLASQWAVFPMMGVTKEGGLVLRCKGLADEGLGADEALKSMRFFQPAPPTTGAAAGAGLAFATSAEAIGGAPPGALGVVGAAVIGAAGAAPTVLHRQAAAFVRLG
mmetsp:Transcript_143667/g.358105  ORF Transcript_143667/g.358105 Transcript_143667/m.358105 type:complete len:645 (+) Transcript_143667:57-1991(+)